MIMSFARPFCLTQADNSPRPLCIRDELAKSSFGNTHTSARLYAPCHVVINLNQSAWGCFEKGAVLSTQPICDNVSLTWSDSWTSKQLIHPTLRCLLWGRTLCKHLPRLGTLIYFLTKLTRSKINPAAAKVHFNKDSINQWTKPIEGSGCRSSLFVL